MPTEDTLVPAAELAAKMPASFPNESDDYRRARTALLAEEIELRRHIARSAARCRPAERSPRTTGSTAPSDERPGPLTGAPGRLVAAIYTSPAFCSS